MLYGGRVAEEIFCGDISAGASDDIRRATELARAMVTELGMSDKVGPINFAERQGSDFLGTELMSGKWHSEETAREIDEEIRRIMREAYDLARDPRRREPRRHGAPHPGAPALRDPRPRGDRQADRRRGSPRACREKTAEEIREERRSATPSPPPVAAPELDIDGDSGSMPGLSPA